VTKDELIELSDLNFAESFREQSRRAGGAVHDEDGLLLWSGATDLPVLMNGAIRTDARLGPEDVLSRARAFFAPRRRGFSVIVRAHADADLRAALERGAAAFGDAPGMVLERPLLEPALPPGVDIRRVESDTDALAFAEVMDAAYGTYGMPPGTCAPQLGRRSALYAPHVVTFLARLDGKPAAGSMVIATHGVGGVYWVGTTPEARGRGLAELCTRRAGNAGFELGARIAALQASVMGEPIYRRMGYVEVTRYPTFVEFPRA
jgi:hypothetical protein